MSRNAFPKIEREQAQAMALREHAAMERKHDVIPVPASELAELKRDAGRYRWLREQKHMDIAACWFLPSEPPFYAFNAPCTTTEIDAAIDAAMQANK
jgi:hypothetical protein